MSEAKKTKSRRVQISDEEADERLLQLEKELEQPKPASNDPQSPSESRSSESPPPSKSSPPSFLRGAMERLKTIKETLLNKPSEIVATTASPRKITLPCPVCNSVHEYKFKTTKATYRYTCRGCSSKFRVNIGHVRKRHSSGNTLGLFGFGILGLLGSVAGTFSHFQLHFQPEDTTEPLQEVSFYALNPFKDLSFFNPNDHIALVYRGDELVALIRTHDNEWLITRTGGVDSLEGLLS